MHMFIGVMTSEVLRLHTNPRYVGRPRNARSSPQPSAACLLSGLLLFGGDMSSLFLAFWA
jgi:hypothetical protein